KLGEATVKGPDTSYVTVQVDSGYFTPSKDVAVPANAKIVDALDDSGNYVAGDKVSSTGKYSYITIRTSDTTGAATITAEALQAYLRGLTFTTSTTANMTQNITVNAVCEPLKAKASNGTDEYDVTLYNGHAYTFVDTIEYWNAAFADAKTVSFLGKSGHLLTVESVEENNLIRNSFNNQPGWMGATRFTSKTTAGLDSETFSITKKGNGEDSDDWGQNWYWVTGPSAGKMFWQGTNTSGKKVDGMYVNWSSGQPDNSGGLEGCPQYGYGSGQWNDLANDYITSLGNQGYYVEFEGFDLKSVGSTVSAAVVPVSVTYDLPAGVSTSDTVNRAVKGSDYSATLSTTVGKLAASLLTVKVKDGDTEKTLTTSQFKFDEKTGLLTIPGEYV
ncbi:hypothetical protein, partial [Bifidobacterium panos]